MNACIEYGRLVSPVQMYGPLKQIIGNSVHTFTLWHITVQLGNYFSKEVKGWPKGSQLSFRGMETANKNGKSTQERQQMFSQADAEADAEI